MWKFFSPLCFIINHLLTLQHKPLMIQSWGDTYEACLMTLDFSRRYSEILAPMTAPVGVNFISRYFPKRLELSLMAVQAFPKASTRGFTCRIFSRSERLFACEESRQTESMSACFLFHTCFPRVICAPLSKSVPVLFQVQFNFRPYLVLK